MLPLRREDKLVIEELPDETLVYDLTRHKAHCLNRTATLVWKSCDGKTTVVELAAIVQHTLKISFAGQDVQLALEQLRMAHLLERHSSGERVSRRDLGRKLLTAGAALVVSVVVPTPASAAGTTCAHGASNCGCSSGNICCKKTGTGGCQCATSCGAPLNGPCTGC